MNTQTVQNKPQENKSSQLDCLEKSFDLFEANMIDLHGAIERKPLSTWADHQLTANYRKVIEMFRKAVSDNELYVETTCNSYSPYANAVVLAMSSHSSITNEIGARKERLKNFYGRIFKN